MKRGVGVGLLCLVASVVYGQTPQKPPSDLPKIVPATPNATKLTEYYAQRPNMYTGTANVSVPLYTIDFDGWKLPISLSYNATGVRANEEASEVGLGWALSATGVISRSVNGGDDFNDGEDIHTGKGYVVADEPLRQSKFGWDEKLDGGPDANDLVGDNYDTSYYLKLVTDMPDTQPDVFNYNFFGYSGSFVLTQQIKGPVRAVKITQDACQVVFDIQHMVFTVITPQGFKGTFDVRERTTTASGVGALLTPEHWLDCCDQGYIDYESLKNSGQYRVTTSWYLSKIVSPRGKQINFTYEISGGRSPNVSAIRSFPEFQDGGPTLRVCTHAIQEHMYLQTITSDEVKLQFSMDYRDDIRKNFLFNSDIHDPNNFPAPRKLKRYTGLVIQGATGTGSSLNKTITFVQSYFNQQYYSCNDDTDDEVRFLRSRLDRVRIDDQEYSFFYESPSGLPDKLTTAVDHFGFFNGTLGAAENMLLPPDVTSPFGLPDTDDLTDTTKVQHYSTRVRREVDLTYGQAGVLKKVVYPTKGYSVFTYDSHRYIPENNTPFIEEIFDSKNGNFAGGTRIQTIKDYNYDGTLALSKEYLYTKDFNAIPVNVTTSGRMMTPLYNRHQRVWMNERDSGFNFVYRTHSGIPGSSAAQGKAIGYSKVHEIVKGATGSQYRNTYIFENNPNTVAAFNVIAVGTPNLNGQMIRNLNYDSTGQVVRAVVNEDYNHVLADPIRGLIYEPVGLPNPYLRYHIPYNLDRTFITPYLVTTITSTLPSQVEQENDSITDVHNSTQATTTSTYNESNGLLKTQETTNSLGQVLKTEYKRPLDYTSPSTILGFMRRDTVNLIESVIEEITSRDNVEISAKANEYAMDTVNNAFVNLKRSYVWNPALGSFTSSTNGTTFSSRYELKITFDKYNEVGKILQYTASDGVRNSFIWGYNNTLPIVHGIGVSYNALKVAYDAAAGNETTLRNHANTNGKQITTYQHDPLVGIKTVTNPSRLTTSYSYDTYSRLQYITDNNSKRLEQYQYNYRQVPETYDVSTSVSELDWGSQVMGSFGTTIIGGVRYPGCASIYRTVTITNNGTADVIVELDMSATSGAYLTPFSCGVITAGNSIPIELQFNPNNVLGEGTYNRQMRFSIKDNETHLEVESIYVDLKAQLLERVCPTSTASVDFGTVSSSSNRTIQLHPPSDGNVGYRVISRSFTDPGVNSGLPFIVTPSGWEYGVELNQPTACILPGSGSGSPAIAVNLHAANVPYTAPKTATLILETSSGCGNISVNLSGWNRGSDYWKHMKLEFLDDNELTSLVMQSSEQTVMRLTNDGENALVINGVSPSMSSTPFSLSSTNFTLQPGEQKDITVTFAPGAYDLTEHTGTFTFNVQLETGETFGGTRTFDLTGQRQELRSLRISESPIGEQKYVAEGLYDLRAEEITYYIFNVGNSSVAFSGDDGIRFSFPDGSGNPGTPSETSDYYTGGVVTPGTPLAPGGMREVKIREHSPDGWPPKTQFIHIEYIRTPGVDPIFIKAFPLIKEIQVSGSPISFEGTDDNFNYSIPVKNTGSVNITPTISFENGDHFSLDGSVPTIVPDETVNLNVKYTSTDFSLQTGSITISGDFSGGKEIDLAAQKIRTYSWSASTSSVVIKPTSTPGYVELSNTGNVEVVFTVIGVSNPNFTLTLEKYSSFTWVTTTEMKIPVDGKIRIKISVSDYNDATGQITITPSEGSGTVVNVSKTTH